MSDEIRGQQYRHSACIVLTVVVALMTSGTHADVGVRAIRIGCARDSDKIEIEPLIAWSEGNSPYSAPSTELAREQQDMVVDGKNLFYSFDFSDREFIYALCNSKTRTVRIFVTNQKEITVAEGGQVVVDALPVGDTWDNWSALYLFRSSGPGTWHECFGPQSAGYSRLKCVRWDSAHPNNTFLSKSSISTK